MLGKKPLLLQVSNMIAGKLCAALSLSSSVKPELSKYRRKE